MNREFFRSIETLFKTEFQFLETMCGCRMRFIRRGVFWRWTAAYHCYRWSMRIIYDEDDWDVYGLIAPRRFGIAPVWLRGVSLESCIIALGGKSEVYHHLSLDRSFVTISQTAASLASILRANVSRLDNLSSDNWKTVKMNANMIMRQRRDHAESIMRPKVEEFAKQFLEDYARADSEKDSKF